MSRLFGRRTASLLRNPGFWLIAVLLVLITIPYYAETLHHPAFVNALTDRLGLTRHAFERILYLGPIVWAGFMFGFRGAFITSVLALVLMLPRTLTSQYRSDTLSETFAVFVIGDILALMFDSLRRARERRIELEAAQQKLTASEQRYRSLFEDAHDAIWLQDMDGNIIAANAAASKLTGYDVPELVGMRVRAFLSPEALDIAREVRRKLLGGETIGESYDQTIRRKDGAQSLVRLSSSLIRSEGRPAGFQHIARDITEETRMQENRRHYLQQITRAQEQERKRISHELHDDTIQSLVVLSRQLDALAGANGLPLDARQRVEELWQQSNSIMQGVRRLSQDLRPAALDRLGLLPALQWLAADTESYSGIPIEVKVIGTERRPTEEVELVLFRVVQEALRNVWRHSRATRAEIIVVFSGDRVKITVTDNGQGFDLPRSVGDLAKEGKLGLAGMDERARLLGGAFTAESHPGKGTIIAIEVAI